MRSRAGSSPLARGLPSRPTRGWPRTRIIPARAGFTATDVLVYADPPDHPRSRGVYAGHACLRSYRLGSSPLARGLLRRGSWRRPAPGIIPARAGFTGRGQPSAAAAPDHPRSRGVYGTVILDADGIAGSSPLARGLLPDGPGIDVEGGIIPARAGFTAGPAVMVRRGADHPRSRGVYPLYCLNVPLPPGSSPLARGLRARPHHCLRELRIIPARAGFTEEVLLLLFRQKDHPRSRGVY